MPDATKVQKTLYFLRHAKAEPSTSVGEDHERGLTERGIEAGAIMGKYLIRQGICPDKVLCSTAERAAETWKLIECAYKNAPTVEFREKLYLASANEMIGMIAQVSEDVKNLMVVGHNPGMHQICLQLAKNDDSNLKASLIMKFPTCALAAITFKDTNWADISRVRGELIDFITPKMLISRLW